MNKTFKRYVSTIVNQTDNSAEAKADLFAELMAHLEESYDMFIKEGYNEKEAEQQVLESFGDANAIGNGIRQAMYPYQRELIFTLVISSFVYSFLVYLLQLFNEGDAHMWWLIISVSINSAILLFVYNVIRVEGKRWINTLLIVHIVIYFFGFGLAIGLDHYLGSLLVMFVSLVMLLSLVLIYLNVIFHWEMSRLKKGFHIFNMSSGLIIIGFNLFFIWAFLLFSEGFSVRSLLLTTPIVLWIIAYIAQIKLIHRGSVKIGAVIAFIPALLIGIIILFQISTFLI